MGLREHLLIAATFSDSYFHKAIDLGCGDGSLGSMLRRKVGYLIGIDSNPEKLEMAKERGVYDELILSDILNYQLPVDADAVFMVESLEHISKEAGYKILTSLNQIPTVVITTPSKFCSSNGHISLWTAKELQDFGYSTYLAKRDPRFSEIWMGKGIIAIKSSTLSYNIRNLLAQNDLTADVNTILVIGAVAGMVTFMYYLAKN